MIEMHRVLIFHGAAIWFRDSVIHRDDGPAIERPSGHRIWYQNGQRHRLDGPAVYRDDGEVEYWTLGEKVPHPT